MMEQTSSTAGRIVEAVAKHGGDDDLNQLAKHMFTMYSQGGFPPDMFLDNVRESRALSESEVIYLTTEYQKMMLDHKRLSGITDERVEKIRGRNVRVIERFIRTGELGIY